MQIFSELQCCKGEVGAIKLTQECYCKKDRDEAYSYPTEDAVGTTLTQCRLCVGGGGVDGVFVGWRGLC